MGQLVPGGQTDKISSELNRLPAPPPLPPVPRDAYLGVSVVANSKSWRAVLQSSDNIGALVLLVIPFSPGARAGLIAGDVIVALDDRPVRNGDQLPTVVRTSSTMDHVLTVVNPRGDVRAVSIKAEARSRPGVPELRQALADNPGAASRFAFATTTADPHTAVKMFGEIASEFPAFAEAEAMRALWLVGSGPGGRPPETTLQVRRALFRAIELDGRSLLVRTTAADVFGNLGDLAEASRQAEAALAIDDTSAVAHYLLGLARLTSGRPVDAVGPLLRSMELDPYNPAAYQRLSEAYRLLGQVGFAEQTDRVLERWQRAKSLTATGQPIAASVGATLAVAIGLFAPVRRRFAHTEVKPELPAGGAESTRQVEASWTVEVIAALAAVSVAVPALAPAIGLSTREPFAVEVIDHAVPGVIILFVCVVWMRLAWTGRSSTQTRPITFGFVAFLGLWMTIPHALLIAEALSGATTPEAVAFHLGPGLATLALSVLVLLQPGRAQVGVRATARPTARPSRSGPARARRNPRQRARL